VHIVYGKVTVQFKQCIIPTHIATVYPRTVLVLWDFLHWHLKTFELIY